MTLKKEIEQFFIVENEIYKFLKIDENYLLLLYQDKKNDYYSYDISIQQSLELLQEFKEKHIFPSNFEKDALTVLKIQMINNYSIDLLSLQPRDSQTELGASWENKKIAYFDKWLQNCEKKLELLELQRNYILEQLKKCE